jgi:hypothetical protein
MAMGKILMLFNIQPYQRLIAWGGGADTPGKLRHGRE